MPDDRELNAAFTPRLMTIIRAAQSLGCHPETLRRAVRSGTLSCYRFGGCTRISPDQLQAYLESALCLAHDTKALNSSNAEDSGTSNGSKTEIAAALRLERRMNAALDSPLRTSKPNLSIIR